MWFTWSWRILDAFWSECSKRSENIRSNIQYNRLWSVHQALSEQSWYWSTWTNQNAQVSHGISYSIVQDTSYEAIFLKLFDWISDKKNILWKRFYVLFIAHIITFFCKYFIPLWFLNDYLCFVSSRNFLSKTKETLSIWHEIKWLRLGNQKNQKSCQQRKIVNWKNSWSLIIVAWNSPPFGMIEIHCLETFMI